jgi:peptide deformylase
VKKMMEYIDASFDNKAGDLNIVPGIAMAANQIG